MVEERATLPSSTLRRQPKFQLLCEAVSILNGTPHALIYLDAILFCNFVELISRIELGHFLVHIDLSSPPLLQFCLDVRHHVLIGIENIRLLGELIGFDDGLVKCRSIRIVDIPAPVMGGQS